MAKFLIKDFQCIEKAVIDVEGLTVLHGDSSAGKSSIIKAIYAAVNNRFRPTQIRHGQEKTTIKVQWENNGPILQVVRRLNGSPSMALKSGDQIQMFDKLNRSVPKEIEEFHRMGNLSVDNDIFSLNFFSQFQKPLLLEFSQKKVMQLMSTSVAFDDYNAAKKQLEINRDKNKGAFQSLSSLKAEYDVKVEKGQHEVDLSEPIISELDQAYQRYRELVNKRAQLTTFKNQIEELKRKEFSMEMQDTIIKKYSLVIGHLNHVEMLEQFKFGLNRIKRINDIVEFCGNKIESLIKIQALLKRNEDLGSLMSKQICLTSDSDKLSNIENRLSKLFSLKQHAALLGDLVSTLNDANMLKRTIINSAFMQSRITQITTIIEEHRCPLCGTKL